MYFKELCKDAESGNGYIPLIVSKYLPLYCTLLYVYAPSLAINLALGN
nr:MAG TPA: hypothetical protein [Bacteriophage sp.]